MTVLHAICLPLFAHGSGLTGSMVTDLVRAIDPLPDGTQMDFLRASSYIGVSTTGEEAVSLGLVSKIPISGTSSSSKTSLTQGRHCRYDLSCHAEPQITCIQGLHLSWSLHFFACLAVLLHRSCARGYEHRERPA